MSARSVAYEMTHWPRRGLLPLPTGALGTGCGCHCILCVYGSHHLGQGLCGGG